MCAKLTSNGGTPSPLGTVLSVIIPVYNEAATIAKVIEQVHALSLPFSKEIVVVNDGSSDGTLEVVRSLGTLVDRVHSQTTNTGKGTAVRIGLMLACGEVAIIQDADLELDPGAYLALLEPILTGRSDVVYGSRFLKKENQIPWKTRVGNWALTALTNLLYGSRLTDMETAYKVFRLQVVRQLRLRAQRFEIEPEITAKLLRAGYRILEVPVSYRPRRPEEGKKIRWRDGAAAVFFLMKYRLVRRSSFLVTGPA